MYENYFMNLLKEVSEGKVEIETMLRVVKIQTETFMRELFEKGEIKITEDQLRMLQHMFNIVRLVDEDNAELQANLYGLIKAALVKKALESIKLESNE